MAAGRELPHDLAQFVVESDLDYMTDFGACSREARHSRVYQDDVRHRLGREIISKSRQSLNAVERLVNQHVTAWRTGAQTPVRPGLDAMFARWNALKVGEEL